MISVGLFFCQAGSLIWGSSGADAGPSDVRVAIIWALHQVRHELHV